MNYLFNNYLLVFIISATFATPNKRWHYYVIQKIYLSIGTTCCH